MEDPPVRRVGDSDITDAAGQAGQGAKAVAGEIESDLPKAEDPRFWMGSGFAMFGIGMAAYIATDEFDKAAVTGMIAGILIFIRGGLLAYKKPMSSLTFMAVWFLAGSWAYYMGMDILMYVFIALFLIQGAFYARREQAKQKLLEEAGR